MNEVNKSVENDGLTVQKRRSFLKKSATGAVLVSLPAKSVWGACTVSGAMSGNLSNNGSDPSCTMPVLSGGRSPSEWQNYESTCHKKFVEVEYAKNHYSRKNYRKERNKYRDEVSQCMGHYVDLPSGLNASSKTVRSCLESNDIFQHLGAVYLNTYFGFYNVSHSGRTPALECCEHVYLYWYMASKSGNVSISNNDLGYHSGKTSWKIYG